MAASVAVVVSPPLVMATVAPLSFGVAVSVTESTSFATHAVYALMAGVNGVGERATVLPSSSARVSAPSVGSAPSMSTVPFTCIFNALGLSRSDHTPRLNATVFLLSSAMDQPDCPSASSPFASVSDRNPQRALTKTA